MSEWMTTGEMIDRLKVGEKAISNIDSSGVKKTSLGIEWEGGRELQINKLVMGYKWKIQPVYVSFEEAIQAMKLGRKVRLHTTNGMVTARMDQYLDVWFRSYSFRQLIEGKWTIEND